MTTAQAPSNVLGVGIYTISEAATYARVAAAKLARWIIGTSNSRPAVKAQIDPSKNSERWITFLDFVQAMAIRDIRITKKIPLEKIREAIEMARSQFGIEYPFARKHTTWLLGEDIRLSIENVGLIEASGVHKTQLDLKPVVEPYLEDLSYDAHGLADGYKPFTWKGYDIVFDPAIQFGEPFVRPGRHTVVTLCDAFDVEGGYDAAAKVFDVKPEAIEAARKYYFDYLRPSDTM